MATVARGSLIQQMRGRGTPITNTARLRGTSSSESMTTSSTHEHLSAMANDAHHVLWCFIKGDSKAFRVTALGKTSIDEVKVLVWEKGRNGVFSGIDAKDLVLWKLNVPEPIKPSQGLAERIALQGDLSQCAIELQEPSDTVLDEFSGELIAGSVHIVVERLPIELDQPSAKRARIQESDVRLLALHKSFWKHGEHQFIQRPVQIPDPLSLEVENDSESLNLTVIEHPEGPEQVFPFGLSKLLVIEMYETFWNLLESEDQEWQTLLRSPGIDRFSYIHHATIVTGQPGIGKSVFLIYVLLRRLVNGLTTIYCDRNTHAHIFDGTGVRRLTLSDGYRIPELDANPQCCALVSLGDRLTLVPDVFYPELRKGRVVVATSPDKNHWSTFAHEHLARICCMPTWEWGPLYIASLLFANKDNFDTVDVDNCKRLQEAYSIFRGIPRLCFRSFTTTGLDAQWAVIDHAINDIQSIDDFIRATTGQLPFNPNTSHRLVRVEPIDARWLKTRTELLSNRIAELVFERIRMVTKAPLSETLVQYLADPDARTKAGILFEHAAHFSIRKGLMLRMTSLSSGTNLKVYIPVTPFGKSEKSRYYSLAIQEKSGSQNVHADFLDLYMTPILKNEPSIDALFISSAYTTFLFQMTVSSHHSINFRGLDKVVNNLPAKAQKDIRIVFIIPSQGPSGEEFRGIQSTQSIDIPRHADTDKVKKFEGFPQYVCRLDIDAAGFRS